ncbi:unnamed protein product [Rotaria sordida]|uniref:Uncharacterized protein n=3 Tax=Rotaria sordida TaxID=392033 RepID=A0A815WSQ5_9BILA|nr:unnamed protein product [Rotaria sordida]CAF1670784.1 unnamed protein product [Rotaria sordida]
MKTSVNSNVPLISNSFVTCYSDYFVIHLYYFPYGNKKVKYSNIRSCEFHSTDDLDMFSYKLWGMSFSPVWWHCDMKRLMRKNYILLDANQWPHIGLTMNDDDLINVYNLIKQKISFNQSNIYNEKLIYDSSNIISEKEIQYEKSFQNIKKD